jgi:hypothetical protein
LSFFDRQLSQALDTRCRFGWARSSGTFGLASSSASVHRRFDFPDAPVAAWRDSELMLEFLKIDYPLGGSKRIFMQR